MNLYDKGTQSIIYNCHNCAHNFLNCVARQFVTHLLRMLIHSLSAHGSLVHNTTGPFFITWVQRAIDFWLLNQLERGARRWQQNDFDLSHKHMQILFNTNSKHLSTRLLSCTVKEYKIRRIRYKMYMCIYIVGLASSKQTQLVVF